MPDDERPPRRRLGDETKERIADLASGWSLDKASPEPAAPEPEPPREASPEPARKKGRTNPPPPPGSAERKALEQKIVATKAEGEPARAKQPTKPPPPPPKAGTGSQPVVSTAQGGVTGPQPLAGSRPNVASSQTARNQDTTKSGESGPQTSSGVVGSPTAGASRSKPATAPPPVPPSRTKRESVGGGGSGPVAQAPVGSGGSGPVAQAPIGSSATKSGATAEGPKSGPKFPRAGYTGPATPFATDVTAKPGADPRASSPALPAKKPIGTTSDSRTSASGSRTTTSETRTAASGSRTVAGEAPTFSGEPHTPAVIVDESLTIPDPVPPAPLEPRPAPRPQPLVRPDTPGPKFAVPVGEFDSGVQTINEDEERRIAAAQSSIGRDVANRREAGSADSTLKRGSGASTNLGRAAKDATVPATADATLPGESARAGRDASIKRGAVGAAQTTLKRDAAEALLKIPDHETPVEDLLEDEPDEPRGDPTVIDPQTAKFERGDPTQNRSPDETEVHAPGDKRLTGGTLRASAALRRKRGLLGDVRYVFTALFGVRASRRELVELEHRQNLRQTSRRRHLVTLGRTAVITDSFDHPAMGPAREQLQAIEEERSKHAGAVAASDAELERVRRDRETKAKQYAADVTATEKELVDLVKKLEPLEKEANTAKRRAAELRESLQRIDKRIAETEALFTSVKGEKLDKAAIEADLATHKADRKAVLRDEPVIAASLDALNPRIASIEATRNELRKKRVELDKLETEDQRRTSELLEAIGAKRKVVERASADAETARDNALFALAERLYVERPPVLNAQLSPIDQIDLELGEGDRRIMELREILSNIDKAKFARGMSMVLVVLGAAGLFAAWVIGQLL